MTNRCNGKCFFCHKEGYSLCDSKVMDIKMIQDSIIPAVQEIGIKKVVFTGGEPTLHKGLLDAIYLMKKSCPGVKVQLTSNGLGIDKLLSIRDYIDKVTLSVSSLDDNIYMKYTMVNPWYLIHTMEQFTKVEKAVSIVITHENADYICDIVSLFIDNQFEVKLQFVISDMKQDDKWERKIVYKLFSNYGKFVVNLDSTPVLVKQVDGKKDIKIKLPSLNKWMYDTLYLRKGCELCLKRDICVERGCSIRVYPNGNVTPCLNNYKIFNSRDVKENILSAYQFAEIMNQ